MQAFSMVDNESFRKFCYLLDRRFVVPERHTVASLIRSSFNVSYERIKEKLSKIESKINLTTDGWVSKAKDPYVAITCHFIDNSWVAQKLILDFFHFPHPHDAFNISEAIKEVSNTF